MTFTFNPELSEFGNIRILHVAETVKGGIATYLSELIPLQISVYGVNSVFVIIPEEHIEYLINVPKNCILSVNMKGGRFWSAFRLASKVSYFLKTNQISILHIHSTYAGLTVRPFVWLNHIQPKIVYCAHGWAFDRNSSSVSRFLIQLVEKLLSYISDAVVCISEHEFIAGQSAGISKSKLVLVKNGISLSAPSCLSPINWPDNRIRLLFVGRFDHQKGFDLMLKAMSNLQDIAFGIMIGEYVVDSPRLISTPDNVAILGWISREELDAYFKGAEVLIMPSRWEGFGYIAIEAMRSELPVFASYVGGLKDIVVNNVTGVFFTANSAEAIVDAVRGLEREKLKKMGRESVNRFKEHFTSERMAKELNIVYQRLLFQQK